MTDVERLVSMIAQLSAAGASIPKLVAAEAYALIRDGLKDAQQQKSRELEHQGALSAPEGPHRPLQAINV